MGDAQLSASIKEVKQSHPFWGYRRVRAWLKYREGLPAAIVSYATQYGRYGYRRILAMNLSHNLSHTMKMGEVLTA